MGFTEVACHPGESDDVSSVYRHERAVECQTLCDPQVKAAIAAEGILLSSFADAAVTATLRLDRTA
jgi:predicted glycoside hydrolase/deacetylase ChbG (UPF0249 family)